MGGEEGGGDIEEEGQGRGEALDHLILPPHHLPQILDLMLLL